MQEQCAEFTTSFRDAADFATDVVDQLTGIVCGLIWVKETGVPAPVDKGFTPERQRGFFKHYSNALCLISGALSLVFLHSTP